jgi:ATP-dependent Clp protease, protease subunit
MSATPGPDRPEISPPFPHRQPGPPSLPEPAVVVPTVGEPAPDVYGRLFDRRRLVLSGPLDHDAATFLCAQLMALDGRSDDEIEVVINSEGGPLADVTAVLDVMGAMRAPVATSCIGMARGTAAVVLACGSGPRRAGQHATISLHFDAVVSLQGTAPDVSREVEQLERLRKRLIDALVVATGQPEERIVHEIDERRFHDAHGAMALGIIDSVVDTTRRTPG